MSITSEANFKNILVFRTGYLGDTLVSLPAFWAVRKAFPEAKLTLLSNADAVNSEYVLAQNILPAKGLFDEWMTYPAGQNGLKQVRSYAKLYSELRRKNFDALIYLMTRNRPAKTIKRDAFFFRLAGIKKVIGAEYLAAHRLEEKARRPLPVVERESEFLIKCLGGGNFSLPPAQSLKPDLLLNEKEKNEAIEWLRSNCGHSFKEKNLIAVAPASKWESKVWGEENFAEVIIHLINQKDVFPIILGSAEEAEKGDRLLKKWKKGANGAGALNIRQAAGVLKNCRMYLGNDTGTMHLAAAVGTPCVAIFAAVDWKGRWHPFGENHHVFRATVECEGCLLPVCPYNNLCLQKISSANVLEACLKTLENGH